jgi:FAD/FMN-containing dehydrogenase
MSTSVMSYVYRPSTESGIRSVFDLARQGGHTVGLRGAGRSYGDASLNAEEICLDLTRMNRILEWNPDSGIITVEPGVTVRDLWQYVIEDGWWPYVVPGTMFPTVGGCTAMNIHGKNNWKVGPIGDHILSFDLLLPSGEVKSCNREENPELFHAAVGGFGMLGCFLRITLQLKRIYSGRLKVTPITAGSLSEMTCIFEERMDTADYLVGWVDCFAQGNVLGRGLVHQAEYLQEGEDRNSHQTLRVENQELPDTFFFGLLSKGSMWQWMRPLINNPGMRLVNWAKYRSSRFQNLHVHRQSHAEFAFLLDYVPNWKWAYRPGGLIQYQSFIPAGSAESVFAEQLSLCHRAGLTPYLGVFKRHREDGFLMTHAVNGYSLALDFRVTSANRNELWRLCAEMDRLVFEAGGRFYFAKDSTLSHARMQPYMEEERVQRFLAIKQECDPESILQTELFCRVFGKA